MGSAVRASHVQEPAAPLPLRTGEEAIVYPTEHFHRFFAVVELESYVKFRCCNECFRFCIGKICFGNVVSNSSDLFECLVLKYLDSIGLMCE